MLCVEQIEIIIDRGRKRDLDSIMTVVLEYNVQTSADKQVMPVFLYIFRFFLFGYSSSKVKIVKK